MAQAHSMQSYMVSLKELFPCSTSEQAWQRQMASPLFVSNTPLVLPQDSEGLPKNFKVIDLKAFVSKCFVSLCCGYCGAAPIPYIQGTI